MRNLVIKVFVLFMGACVFGSSASISSAAEMRANFVDRCPATGVTQDDGKEAFGEELLAGVVASVASQLVGGILDEFAQALTSDGGTALDVQVPVDNFLIASDSESAGGVSFNPSTHCIWVAVAEQFGSEATTETEAMVPFKVDGNASAKKDVAAATLVATPILFYFEGVVRPSHDQTAWTIVPKYWYSPRFIEPAGFWRAHRRDVRLAFAFAKPGKTDGFATTELKWVGVAEGSVSLESVRSKVLPWMAAPDYAKPSVRGGFFPVNVRVQLAETAHPYKLAKYLGAAISTKKSAITTEVSSRVEEALSEQARVSARAQLAEAAKTSLATYKSAYENAKKAYEEWSVADERGKAVLINGVRLAYLQLDQAKMVAAESLGRAGVVFTEFPPLPPAA